MSETPQLLEFKDKYELGSKPFKEEVEPNKQQRKMALIAIEAVKRKFRFYYLVRNWIFH